jgi:hypothetical protein
MKTEKFKGTISSAYGQKLAKALPFTGTYEAFGTDEKDEKDYTPEDWQAALDEIRKSDESKPAGEREYPNNADLVTFVNNKRLANARQKQMTATLDAAGIEKPTLQDEKFRFEQMVKILVAAGQSENEAKATASAALNYNPAAA